MADAKAILDAVKVKMTDAVRFLEEDLKTYRAGKANILVFNPVMVNYYGSMVPIANVASITTPDAKTIAIQPWERNMIQKIEKAIIDANVGLNPQNNGEVIRCTVPALTEDRRKELIKKAKGAGENAKIVIRNARRDGIELLKKANNKEAYDTIADEIFRLRELKQQTTVDTVSRDEQIKRITALQDFICSQPAELTEFDETLVRRWVQKITVWSDKYTVELKSGIRVDIET